VVRIDLKTEVPMLVTVDNADLGWDLDAGWLHHNFMMDKCHVPQLKPLCYAGDAMFKFN